MSEMVKRVARALCVLDGHEPKAHLIREYEREARVAIVAMKEPTRAMGVAGYVVQDANVDSAYRAMIDAALD